MIKAFEHKILSLTSKLRCSDADKLEIEMELRDHLYSSYEHYLSENYQEATAIELAIKRLGLSEVLASQYQEVVTPIYGPFKKLMKLIFYAYSIIALWKLFFERLIVRIIDYIQATEPYQLKYVYSNSRLWDSKQFFDFSLWKQNINVIPLEMIVFYLMGDRVNLDIAVNNLLGNLIILLPLGFLIPLLFKSCQKFHYVVAIAFYTSLTIECLQFVLQIGMADIDDLILNTIGAILGYVLYLSAKKIYLYQLKWKSNR